MVCNDVAYDGGGTEPSDGRLEPLVGDQRCDVVNDDTLAITDTCNHRIVFVGWKDDTVHGTVGSRGPPPFGLNEPRGIVAITRSLLVVFDGNSKYNQKVQFLRLKKKKRRQGK